MTKTVDFGRRGDAFNRWIYSLAQARPTEFGSSRFTFTDVDGVWRQYGSRPEWLALIETKTRAKDALSLVYYGQARALRQLAQLCEAGAASGERFAVDHTGRLGRVEFRGTAGQVRLSAETVTESAWFEVNRIGSQPQPLVPTNPLRKAGDSDSYRLR